MRLLKNSRDATEPTIRPPAENNEFQEYELVLYF